MTTSADQTARVWRTTDFSEVQVLQHEAKRWVWDAAFSADSQYIFTGKYCIFLLFLNPFPLRSKFLSTRVIQQLVYFNEYS